MLRRARQERREERRGGGPSFSRYQMRQKMVAIGDDFWIENDQGQKVFKVDGKALRVRDTLIHEYRVGEGRNKIAEVSKKWFRVRDTYGVEIAENQDDILILAATVAFDMMAHPTR